MLNFCWCAIADFIFILIEFNLECYQDNMMYNIHRMYIIPIVRGLCNLVSPQFSNISLEIAEAVKLYCFGETVTNDKDLVLIPLLSSALNL